MRNNKTSFAQCDSANFSIITALVAPILLLAAGGAIDIHAAYDQRQQMQAHLDGGLLAAARESDLSTQQDVTADFISTFDTANVATQTDGALSKRLKVVRNTDGSLTGVYSRSYTSWFLGLVGMPTLPLSVTATVNGAPSTPPTSSTATQTTAGSCLYVLGNQSQAVLINSGVNLKSNACRIDVHSTADPAFIMNGGSTVDTAEFCVKGTKYIKNGGTLSNLKTACAVNPDPYRGKFAEPKLPSSCTTTGARDGSSFTLEPGMHCDVTFNGSPSVTFKPGLHIIKGRMILNSGSTVTAKGVTFYFPDVDSEIRANGGLTFTGSPSTSGAYKDILMFEKTSDAASNSRKTQYIFNGSKGENIEGIIYLPNRDVTYNSTTNQTSKISMVVNSVIMNTSNWRMEPFTPSATASTTTSTSNGGSTSNVGRLVK
ncbi:pilus assembly protein [Rhizobium lemnae]|uniref:TadE/TadG family type IV pilus assembly protein n=1 Tax=Rhizobium lemnae TaxID=1214924 RepID=A0ABV8EB74_9HYPH|nr:TadE/TadG family type IV pilus assembly protein [Rhizobium lemnae]MCJ8509101.1 pilus assembly protein [Rhizobium lemnae]